MAEELEELKSEIDEMHQKIAELESKFKFMEAVAILAGLAIVWAVFSPSLRTLFHF